MVSPDQSKYIKSLEIRLSLSEDDVKSKQTDLLALQKKLDKQVHLSRKRIDKILDHGADLKILQSRLEKAEAEATTLRTSLETSEVKAKNVQSELDDLLLVLGEMEEKQSHYVEKIKALGGEITDDEEE